MSTTDHPTARTAEETLRVVAADLAKNWAKGTYGVPEAVASSTGHDTRTRIIVERALVRAGIDVWWNDLVCSTPSQAGAAVEAVAAQGVDLELLYGPRWDAIIGILKAAVLMDTAKISSLSYHLSGHGYSTLFDHALELARVTGTDRLLAQVCEDVHFAAHRDVVKSQAAVGRWLAGVRVLELAAAYYVLEPTGHLPNVDGNLLLAPIKAALFPEAPKL